ncbi:MAG: exosortase/archaeosortase family protein [Candidatus Omnitrophica bacterium]|nr:exosortase/archaeosortase family protein [Candidatus Omnitrophota bacterium]
MYKTEKQNLAKLILLSIFLIITYVPTFIWMFDRWNEKDTYYSHGILVPFISIFLVWLQRKELKKIKLNPDTLGWFFFIPAILIHLLSALWRVYFTSGFSLLFILTGLVLLFWGKEYLKKLIFPILFLIFMIPLPLVAIANISFKLKIFAAQASTYVLNNLFGIPAVRDGSVIKTMHAYLIVEDPCSGIRSLIALIALGALMTYFSNLSKPRKVVLFASSVPIAISTNIIRILALSLVSEMYGAKFSTGLFHDTMGVLVFVFAFIGLMLVGKLLD